jgi:hypothetical protein
LFRSWQSTSNNKASELRISLTHVISPLASVCLTQTFLPRPPPVSVCVIVRCAQRLGYRQDMLWAWSSRDKRNMTWAAPHNTYCCVWAPASAFQSAGTLYVNARERASGHDRDRQRHRELVPERAPARRWKLISSPSERQLPSQHERIASVAQGDLGAEAGKTLTALGNR